MNVSNVQDDLVLAQFSNEDPLISVRQLWETIYPFKKEIRKKCQLQPELGDHEAQDPGEGEGGHLLGPEDHCTMDNFNFFDGS